MNIETCRVTAYAREVLSGEIIAGPHVRAACARHMDDLKYAPSRGLVFDTEARDRVFRFFETKLFLSEGQFENRPFKLQPMQSFIVGSLFGWLRNDGTRRFRRAYVEAGKGCGKSPLVGGIGLYGMAADREPGAQIYAMGATRDQAGILLQDAVKMALKSPELKKRITFSGNVRPWRMTMLGKPQSGSFFVALSRESGKSGSGPRPHFGLCDELHEHQNRDVVEMVERGFKFRRQPLLIMITNSGTDRNSVCFEEHTHAVAVAHREIEDDSTFSYVCALDTGDDPLNDPSCWIKTNPLLGVTLSHEYLAAVVQQAKQIPGKLNGILRLHFCVWTDAETAWMSRETWEKIEDETMRIEDFEGCVCHAGLDLAAKKDLAGKVLVFEDGFTDEDPPRPKFAAFAHGYTPRDTLAEREKLDKAPYDLWVRDGHLTATSGSVIRFDTIAYDLKSDAELYDLKSVAYDQYLIKRFEEILDEENIELPLIEHPQGYNRRKDTTLWMPGSIDFLEELILEGRLRVHVNPALRSAVAKATFAVSPANLRRFQKAKATGRIDLLVALAMAVGAAQLPYQDKESVYETLARDRVRNGIDYKVLNDPNHAHHKDMVRRFERLQALEDDD